jgi:scaffold protein (connect acetoacetyl-CoA thiolase and HMG-CoA synthase)
LKMTDGNSITELKALRCKVCGKLHIHPRYHCGGCSESVFSEINLKGSGEVYSFTIIRMPFEEFQEEAPYAFGELRLDEGLVVPGRFTNEGEIEIKIGGRVSFDRFERGINWFKLI